MRPRRLQEGLSWGKMSELRLRWAEGWPKMAPRWPEMGPDGPMVGPRGPQYDPKRAQDGANMAPGGPKRAPRWPQLGPRCRQDGPTDKKMRNIEGKKAQHEKTLKNLRKNTVFEGFRAIAGGANEAETAPRGAKLG